MPWITDKYSSMLLQNRLSDEKNPDKSDLRDGLGDGNATALATGSERDIRIGETVVVVQPMSEHLNLDDDLALKRFDDVAELFVGQGELLLTGERPNDGSNLTEELASAGAEDLEGDVIVNLSWKIS